MTTETIEKEKISVKEKQDIQPPKMYKVFILNDNTTTFDFVIAVLMRIFGHSFDSAEKITLDVHYNGKGLAGIYPHDIAETKADETCQVAKSAGFPLRAVIEQEE